MRQYRLLLGTALQACAATAVLCIFSCVQSRADRALQIDLAGNVGWSFKADGSAVPARPIRVPAGGWRLNGFPSETAGTYERHITIPRLKGYAAQVTILDFEAVNWEATISVGPDASRLKQAAVHLSAWTPFRVDISHFVTPGGSALLRVHVRDRTYFKNSRNQFTVPAGPQWNDRAGRGILRGVSLKVFPEVYIEDLFIQPSTQMRTLKFNATLRNASRIRRSAAVSAYLSFATGPSVRPELYPAIPDSTVMLEPGETKVVTVGPVKWTLPSSRDWWPNIPFLPNYRAALHRLSVSVKSNAAIGTAPETHTLSARFGFCTMAQKGSRYTLNGVPINLRGDSLPEGTIGTDAFARMPGFLPPTGPNAPTPCAGWPGAVRNYQRLNYNVIRMHQVPCTRYMMDVCDELGMLVIPETAIRGGGVLPESIQENPDAFTTHLKELILRDRNHPSVAKWSLENELPAAPVPFLRRLYDTCMQTDGTRPCSIDVFDKAACPDWPGFAVIDHYTQAAGSPDPAGGIIRGDKPKGEGEYVWPLDADRRGPVWFGLETRDMRRHNNSDLRPYALIDIWPGAIPNLSPDKFPDPHTTPDSLEQGGRALLDPPNPWKHPLLRLIQRSFAPVAAFDPEYDRANMPSNGNGEWPIAAPVLQGGSTVVRHLEVFNDDLAGDSVKLVYLPALVRSETDSQPLPETTRELRIPPGGHVQVDIPVAAPPVSECTALVGLVMLWKGGEERFREEQMYVVNPSGRGNTFAEYIGMDSTTGGDWVDAAANRVYGNQAFMVPKRGGRSVYEEPSLFIRRVGVMLAVDEGSEALAQDEGDAEIAWTKDLAVSDSRIPWNGPGRLAREPVAFAGRKGAVYFRLDCRDASAHMVSVYLLNFKKGGPPLDVDIYDTRLHRIASRRVEAGMVDGGVFVKYLIRGSVYIAVESLNGDSQVTASGLFVDPAPARKDID